jgi:galactokinase
MEKSRKDLFSETKDKFIESFGDVEKCKFVLSPASLVFLGDHTHYNEGVLLSAAVDRYVAIAGRLRKDGRILIVNKFTRKIIDLDKIDEAKSGSRFPEKFIFNLLNGLREKGIINCGFEFSFTSDIPDCLGLGSVAAHQVAFLKLINNLAKLKLKNTEIVNLGREMAMMLVGRISNEAHYWTVLNSRQNNLVFSDLRTKAIKNIQLDFSDYEIVAIDTEAGIPDAPKICSERIEECEIGANALKMYFWGIKTLRDVSEDFLKKKVLTLPKRLYQRINYNVQERIRVEEAIKHIYNGDINEFGGTILDSHKNISADYILSSSQIDYIVDRAVSIDGVIAAKMISCSPKRSLFSIVNKNYTDNYISEIRKSYSDKYGAELSIYKLNISSGVKLFKHLEEVFA